MDIFSSLKQAGFNKSETTIYLFLLQNGLSTPPEIARGTAIARTNCYNVLHKLESEGVVSEIALGKRKAYQAEDPASIVRSLMHRTESIQALVPDLRAMHITHKHKPKIQFFDGYAALKKIFDKTLESKKIIVVAPFAEMSESIKKYYVSYLSEARSRGIEVREIAATGVGSHIILWDERAAFITAEEPMFGTVVVSAPLAHTLRTLAEQKST